MESPTYLHAGKVINSRYRLITPLGSGTLAQVYLADDIRVRKQTIVKVFDAPFRSGNDVQDDFQIVSKILHERATQTSLKFWIGAQGDLLYRH